MPSQYTMHAFQSLCYACPPLSNYLRSGLAEKDLCTRRRASCEFARTVQSYYHALVDGTPDVDDKVLETLGRKLPKKLANGLQYTLKTLHTALEVATNSSFITDCFSFDKNGTVFIKHHDGDTISSQTLQLDRAPPCLLASTAASFYPFDLSINDKEFSLHAVFDANRCIYYQDSWKEWDGVVTREVANREVCRITGPKILSYIQSRP